MYSIKNIWIYCSYFIHAMPFENIAVIKKNDPLMVIVHVLHRTSLDSSNILLCWIRNGKFINVY